MTRIPLLGKSGNRCGLPAASSRAFEAIFTGRSRSARLAQHHHPEPAWPELALRICASSRAWGSGASNDNIERFNSFSPHAQSDVLTLQVFSDNALEVLGSVEHLSICGHHDFSFP